MPAEIPDPIGREAREVFAEWSDVKLPRNVPDERVEIVVEREDGARWMDVTLAPLVDDRGEVLGRALLAHDVTSRKAVEAELARRNLELEAANRELDEFTHSVSHDLGAPLRAIEAFSRLLAERSSGRLDGEGREHLEEIRRGTGRMQRLIRDLLAFARTSRQRLKTRTVEPEALVRSVLEELREERGSRDIELEVGHCLDARPTVAASTSVREPHLECHQVQPRAGPRARRDRGDDGTTTLLRRRRWGGVRSGECGETLRHLQHGQERFEGNGVGLAIAQRIVQRHGGEIWANRA